MKNNKDYTTIIMRKDVLKKLIKIKIHPKESYTDVIERILEAHKK